MLRRIKNLRVALHVLTFFVFFISQRQRHIETRQIDISVGLSQHHSSHGSSPELNCTTNPLHPISSDSLHALRATLGPHEMHLRGDSRQRNVRRQIQHREPSRRSSSPCFPQNHRQGKQQHIRNSLESYRIFHQLILLKKMRADERNFLIIHWSSIYT